MTSAPDSSLPGNQPTAKGGWFPDWTPWAVLAGFLGLGVAGGLGFVPLPGGSSKSQTETPPVVEAAPAAAPAAASAKADEVLERGGMARPAGLPETVEARQILVQYEGAWKTVEGLEVTEAEAQKRADEALAKLKRGEDWAKVMEEYTNNPAAKKNGGAMGELHWDKVAGMVRMPIFSLKVGETSKVEKSLFGFSIYQRTK